MRNYLLEAVKNPGKVANKFLLKFGKNLSDEEYIRRQYRYVTGKTLNLTNPRTFNEKLQWLKLYNRKPEQTIMADKYAAREWITDRLCSEGYDKPENYLPKLYGKYASFDEIDFDALPDRFVLKTNHDSGGVVLVADKSKMDKAAARDKLTRSLNRNYYWMGREWPYKDIKPCIIAEEHLGDNISDYKFFCFNGQLRYIQVIFDRFIQHKMNFYTPEWKYIPLEGEYPTFPNITVDKPEKLSELIKISEILSKDIPFLRVDFYYIRNEIIIGELTLTPTNGHAHFNPESYGEMFGDWIELG
jgi:hypothetical protein